MTRPILCIHLLLMFCNWNYKIAEPIEKVQWLVGTWQNKTAKGIVYETWTQISKLVLTGKSYKIMDKDTVVFETIRIQQEDDHLFYIPQVKDQNGGLPVRFLLKTLSDDRMVFENQEHDFPQIISYHKITADSLVAKISGVKNGNPRKQIFPMKKSSP